MQMLAGGAGLLMASALTGEFNTVDVSSISLVSWLSLAYLIVMGSIAFSAYVWLLSKSSASKVATYAYVNPIVAILLGALIADETFSFWALTCSTIVILAVGMVILPKTRPESKAPAPPPTVVPATCQSCK
jgi:drug/metabolite transporter (DMT)-like permease